jgi:hypothetical protein
MKECSRCKTSKDFVLFPKRSKSKDGLHAWCTPCNTAYARDRYIASPDERNRKKKNQKSVVEKSRKFIYEYLQNHPCIVCGESDPIVLEFDHREPSKKESNVSELLKFSVNKVRQEVAKCDVMCANCHRRKTADQFGTWKTKYGV